MAQRLLSQGRRVRKIRPPTRSAGTTNSVEPFLFSCGSSARRLLRGLVVNLRKTSPAPATVPAAAGARSSEGDQDGRPVRLHVGSGDHGDPVQDVDDPAVRSELLADVQRELVRIGPASSPAPCRPFVRRRQAPSPARRPARRARAAASAEGRAPRRAAGRDQLERQLVARQQVHHLEPAHRIGRDDADRRERPDSGSEDSTRRTRWRGASPSTTRAPAAAEQQAFWKRSCSGSTRSAPKLPASAIATR